MKALLIRFCVLKLLVKQKRYAKEMVRVRWIALLGLLNV